MENNQKKQGREERRKALVLYSGGKDSSLAAVILRLLGYEIELLTANFGFESSYRHASRAADALGFRHRVIKMSRETLEEAAEMISNDGFPNYGIDFLHKKVLEEVVKSAGEKGVIADGIRRDDRAPKVAMSDVRRLEDKYGISYLSPLKGFGHKEIEALAKSFFIFAEGESDKINKGDYESEIRKCLKMRGCKVEEIFPKNHKQSIVIGYKNEQDVIGRKIKTCKSA